MNKLFEIMMISIKTDSNLSETDKKKRESICKAHLLYARNLYEMRITKSTSNPPHLKDSLNDKHACVIVLSCLLDSDALRIVETHSCKCDSYVYLFSTKVKFCAWKAKLFVILKRPNRSSIDRLNLIEDISNCHKIINSLI